MKKKHSRNSGTGREWKNPFPYFGKGNQRLSFLGMDRNGNSRSPLFNSSIKKIAKRIFFEVQIPNFLAFFTFFQWIGGKHSSPARNLDLIQFSLSHLGLRPGLGLGITWTWSWSSSWSSSWSWFWPNLNLVWVLILIFILVLVVVLVLVLVWVWVSPERAGRDGRVTV